MTRKVSLCDIWSLWVRLSSASHDQSTSVTDYSYMQVWVMLESIWADGTARPWCYDVGGNNHSPVLAKISPPLETVCLPVTSCGCPQAGRVLPKASPGWHTAVSAEERRVGQAYFSPLPDSGNLWLYWHSLAVNLSSCERNVAFQLNSWF